MDMQYFWLLHFFGVYHIAIDYDSENKLFIFTRISFGSEPLLFKHSGNETVSSQRKKETS